MGPGFATAALGLICLGCSVYSIFLWLVEDNFFGSAGLGLLFILISLVWGLRNFDFRRFPISIVLTGLVLLGLVIPGFAEGLISYFNLSFVCSISPGRSPKDRGDGSKRDEDEEFIWPDMIIMKNVLRKQEFEGKPVKNVIMKGIEEKTYEGGTSLYYHIYAGTQSEKVYFAGDIGFIVDDGYIWRGQRGIIIDELDVLDEWKDKGIIESVIMKLVQKASFLKRYISMAGLAFDLKKVPILLSFCDEIEIKQYSYLGWEAVDREGLQQIVSGRGVRGIPRSDIDAIVELNEEIQEAREKVAQREEQKTISSKIEETLKKTILKGEVICLYYLPQSYLDRLLLDILRRLLENIDFRLEVYKAPKLSNSIDWVTRTKGVLEGRQDKLTIITTYTLWDAFANLFKPNFDR